MKHGTCNICKGEKDRHGCPRCDDPVARLEKMRQSQQQYWRDVRAGKIVLKRPPKRGQGAYFIQQCRQAAAHRRAAQLEELPLSGQDAALPVGDR